MTEETRQDVERVASEYVPEEGDGFIQPTGALGAKTEASLGGVHLGVYDTDDEAIAAIRHTMTRSGWYPNLWTISDHGNFELYRD